MMMDKEQLKHPRSSHWAGLFADKIENMNLRFNNKLKLMDVGYTGVVGTCSMAWPISD